MRAIAVFSPHKKGTLRNVKGIDLSYKIIALAIENRRNSTVSGKIGRYHCGFGKNRSVMVFILKQIIDNSKEQNLSYTCYLYISNKPKNRLG